MLADRMLGKLARLLRMMGHDIEEEKQDLLERMIGPTMEETHERDDDDRI